MDWADVFFPSLIVCGIFGIMLAVAIGCSYLWLMWLNKRATKCPECGKTEAGELVEDKLIESKSHLEWKTHGSASRDPSPLRVTEETYEEHFECRYCGHRWVQTAQWTRTTPVKRDKGLPSQER
jgi:DNA-directed RNA polymerase subunit RPC12/RpoP